jgi:CubicO group peptidase (beta-lactamase class C family)
MRPSRTRLPLWLPLLLLALPGAIAAAPALPDTPPAHRLTEVLELVNAGDRRALASYAGEHFAPSMLKPDADSILDFLMAQYEVNGGYDVRRVLQSSSTQISVLAQGRRATDRWMRVVVGADSLPPHRVTGIFLFRSSEALAADDDEPIPAGELPARLAETVDRIAATGRFSGTVCLARGDSALLLRAWGEADREAQVPNRPETRFNIASVGKMFTAVAVAQLVAAGRLRWEDPVARHIPDWLGPTSRSITVAQLLEHTSGLGDFLGRIAEDPARSRYRRLQDYRAIALADTPAFEPGTGFRYSNVGYLVLGALVESISGRPWDRYLAEEVFAPARMRSTSAYRPPTGERGVARGYVERPGGGWVPNDSLLAGLGSPAGGAVSTAADLAAFARALRHGRLIPPAMLDSLLVPRAAMEGTGLLYGRGFTIARGATASRMWGHAGGFPGASALLEVHEDGGWVLAVLSNTTDGAGIVGDAWRDLLGRGTPSAPGR